MPIHIHVLTLLAVASSGSKGKPPSTGGNYTSLIVILALVGAMYFLFMRPRSKQAQAQRAMHSTLSPGDEVLTGAGIYGTVLDVYPDRITIETAPGTRLTVARSTVNRKIEPTTEDDVAAGGHGEGMDVDDLQARLGSGVAGDGTYGSGTYGDHGDDHGEAYGEDDEPGEDDEAYGEDDGEAYGEDDEDDGEAYGEDDEPGEEHGRLDGEDDAHGAPRGDGATGRGEGTRQ